jgi:hypothetical protein
MTSPTNTFGIDVETVNKATVLRRLRALKTTVEARDGGMYHADRTYSQVHVDTTKTEAELESWLYNTKGVEAVGVFVIEKIQETI